MGNARQIDAPSHVVQFYDDDAALVQRVAEYLVEGLAGGPVVVIATPEHREALARALPAGGDVVILDAEETLSRFMVDGAPDLERFDASVGELVRDAARGGRPARAFGEMVAVLWERGNVTGAIALEELWNDLLDRVGFSLFCAYPGSVLGEEESDGVARVCELHSHVIMPRDVRTEEAAQAFPFEATSPGAARRFVAETLMGWGRGALIEDASVVTTELTSNVLVHVGTGFTVKISRHDDVIRIGVVDASRDMPVAGDARKAALGGRGLLLIKAMASRWGADRIEGGKIVWAELSAGSPS